MQFCILGAALTIKNDQVKVAIYDTKWYDLPVEEQKMLAIVLHKSQNSVEMTIGGLALLNMETFVQILKMIYSYFAMLLQLME
ncbi:putative odorant receptor 83c [Uranotaenia lowii]|uniref:putative odorant receptor 83c n=1 Tax=Uranotaenia lowii TaxID=190385 RepID=UPI00247A5F97|nr:putative odorant receptor 83c [Uranotaenia lowii]